MACGSTLFVPSGTHCPCAMHHVEQVIHRAGHPALHGLGSVAENIGRRELKGDVLAPLQLHVGAKATTTAQVAQTHSLVERVVQCACIIVGCGERQVREHIGLGEAVALACKGGCQRGWRGLRDGGERGAGCGEAWEKQDTYLQPPAHPQQLPLPSR
jgi:hypothetical protein